MPDKSRQVSIPGKGEVRTDYTQAEKRPKSLNKYFRPILVLSIITFIIYLIFFSAVFQVGKIVVSGKTSLPSEEILRQVNQAISSQVTGRNILFLNTSQVADYLTQENYQLSEVKVERTFINGLKINIKEKQPSIVWRSGVNSYVLSDDGRAITDNSNGYSDLPVIVDTASLPVKLGDRITPTNFVRFALDMLNGLKERGIKVTSMEVPETTSELYAKTDKGYLIKFDTNKSISSQLTSLDSVIKTLSKQNKKPNEYIDLRVEGRVFYK